MPSLWHSNDVQQTKSMLQSNVAILEPEVLVYCTFGLCYLCFFLFLMSCHYFKTFLIKPQCTCKTKIFEKGQRALSFVGSVPEILQQSLQMLITLQLSVLEQCLFINNENFFSCMSLQYSGSCRANLLLHVFVVYKPCHLCIRRK